MQSGKGDNMVTFEAAAKELVARREITVEQAIALTNNPKLFDGDDPAEIRRRMIENRQRP
jgi:Tfp pilus assembly pilus retraction ATPase PilT